VSAAIVAANLTWRGGQVADRKVVCACGLEVVATNDSELFVAVRKHVDAVHPDLFKTDAELVEFLRDNAVDA
jgi:predicted small metal-binding protein